MQSGQMRPSLPTVLTRICDGGNGRGDGDDDDKAHFKYHLSCIKTREALSNPAALFKDALS
jgi:hypothetical protein